MVTGTHTDIAEFYKRFYYPGNCVIAFHGNIPLEDELRAIVEPYLLDYVGGEGPALSKRSPPTPILYRDQPNLPELTKDEVSAQARVSSRSARRVRFVEYGVSKETKALKRRE